ncbi:MAG: hypothetical protein GKC10_08335 [Methanosarcinales archaeon]|nr:hypothetical protein [Methanosarcinales archaeon]
MGSSSIKTMLGDLPPAFFASRPLSLSDSSPLSDSCLSPRTSSSSGSDGSCQGSGSSPSPGSSPPSPRPSIPGRLISKILEISGIPEGLQCAQLTRQMRIALLDNLTGLPLEISSLGGYDLAMVTRGGVDLREVNSRTMESRLVPGLYLVGEVLDVDGDTGGYNLQAAFSTGMLAARSIARMPGQSARTTRRTTGRG